MHGLSEPHRQMICVVAVGDHLHIDMCGRSIVDELGPATSLDRECRSNHGGVSLYRSSTTRLPVWIRRSGQAPSFGDHAGGSPVVLSGVQPQTRPAGFAPGPPPVVPLSRHPSAYWSLRGRSSVTVGGCQVRWAWSSSWRRAHLVRWVWRRAVRWSSNSACRPQRVDRDFASRSRLVAIR